MKRALAVAACAMVMVGFGATQRAEAAAPIINSLSPNTKVAGSGAFVITVTGSNFTTGSVARWNGTAISTGYVSSTQLSATVGSSLVASTGTASVTVYTSGRKGGTSNTISFTITAPTVTAPPPAPAPAPAPSPLSITTSTLPGGTAGAPLSATVAATGGTPAYGWALVNGGGALPPGLTLAATGTISGTPSQSGTFTFTTQANDSSSQIAQKVLSLVVEADPNATTTPPPTTTTGTIYFQDGWESQNWGKWKYVLGAPTTTNTHAVEGSFAGLFHFDESMCGTSLTCSVDKFAVTYFDAGHGFTGPIPLNHVFIRTRFRWNTSVNPPSGIGRKLYYVQPSNLNDWRFTLAVDQGSQKLHASSSPTTCQTSGWGIYGTTILQPDTWYSIKMEFNFLGAGSDVIRVWINGNLEFESSPGGQGSNLRGTCQAASLYAIRVGEQATRSNGEAFNEDRLVDDVVIADYDPGD